jgi:hypothetical protein
MVPKPRQLLEGAALLAFNPSLERPYQRERAQQREQHDARRHPNRQTRRTLAGNRLLRGSAHAMLEMKRITDDAYPT